SPTLRSVSRARSGATCWCIHGPPNSRAMRSASSPERRSSSRMRCASSTLATGLERARVDDLSRDVPECFHGPVGHRVAEVEMIHDDVHLALPPRRLGGVNKLRAASGGLSPCTGRRL